MAEYFGKNHRDVTRKIELLIEGGVRGFTQTPYVHPQNNQEYKMYQIEEKAFMILVMGFEGPEALEFKQKFVDAFVAMREELSKPNFHEIPKTFSEALMLAARQAEQLEHQEATLKLQAPKVATYEDIMSKEGYYSLRDGNKIMGLKPTKFNEWLRERCFLYKKANGSNLPYQTWIDKGLFEVKTASYDDGHMDTETGEYISGYKEFSVSPGHSGFFNNNNNATLRA